MAEHENKICANCGHSIGKLEPIYEFNENIVCAECIRRLSSNKTPQKGEIICPNPNCGYVGEPKKQARGSLVIGCLLSCLFLLPGVLYFALMSGYTYVCPRCGIQLREGKHH